MNPFVHEKRKRFTPQERAEVFARDGGHCQGGCTRKLGPSDDWDLDHIIALENGGSNDLSNVRTVCEWCHKGKTADDHHQAAKGRRVYVNRVVPKRFRTSRAWRR